ncbi:hypothetical protein JCM8208_000918 [Rhodotorula glutinis]
MPADKRPRAPTGHSASLIAAREGVAAAIDRSARDDGDAADAASPTSRTSVDDLLGLPFTKGSPYALMVARKKPIPLPDILPAEIQNRIRTIVQRTEEAFAGKGNKQRSAAAFRLCQGGVVGVAHAALNSATGKAQIQFIPGGQVVCTDSVEAVVLGSPQDARNRILDLCDPFVLIAGWSDVSKLVAHGDFRAQGVALAQYSGLGLSVRLIGPHADTALHVVITPENWRPKINLDAHEVLLSEKWLYVGPADAKRELKKLQLYSAKMRTAVRPLLEAVARTSTRPSFPARALPSWLQEEVAHLPLSPGTIPSTVGGGHHLGATKHLLEIPLLAQVLSASVSETISHDKCFARRVQFLGSSSSGCIMLVAKMYGADSRSTLEADLECLRQRRCPLVPLEVKQSRRSTHYGELPMFEPGTSKDGAHAFFQLMALSPRGGIAGFSLAVYAVDSINAAGVQPDDNLTLLSTSSYWNVDPPTSSHVKVAAHLVKNILMVRANVELKKGPFVDDEHVLKMLRSYKAPDRPWDPATAITDYAELIATFKTYGIVVARDHWDWFAKEFAATSVSSVEGRLPPELTLFLLASADESLAPDERAKLVGEYTWAQEMKRSRTSMWEEDAARDVAELRALSASAIVFDEEDV